MADSLTPLVAAGIGFLGGCASQVLGVFLKSDAETRAQRRRSAQLLSAIRRDQIDGIMSVLTIEKLIDGEGVAYLDKESIEYFSQPRMLNLISLQDPVNPMLLADALKLYSYIKRFTYTNNVDDKRPELLVFDQHDRKMLSEGINRAIAEYILSGEMRYADDNCPKREVSGAEIDDFRARLRDDFFPMLPRVVDRAAEKADA